MSNIKGVAQEIMKQLEYYATDVKENVEKAKRATARNMVAELKETSPENRPSYKEGWRTKRTSKALIVHNKTDYQLTHLLEYGHPMPKKGTRNAEAKPHIRPAEQRHIKEYLQKVERAVKK